MKLIGLSLSFCIKNICEDLIDVDEVAGIVPAFAITPDNDIKKVWERYCKSYWSGYPNLAWDAIHAVKIMPQHPTPVNIAAGHWMLESDYSTQMQLAYDHDSDVESQDCGEQFKMTVREAIEKLKAPTHKSILEQKEELSRSRDEDYQPGNNSYFGWKQ